VRYATQEIPEAQTLGAGTIDDPSACDMSLSSDFADVMLQLLLCASGDTQSLGGTGSGHPHSQPPAGAFTPGAGYPERDRLAARWSHAKSDAARRAVLEAAETELASWKGSHVAVDTLGFDELVIRDGEGYPAQMVGERFGIAEAHVRRIRYRAGRSAEDGSDPQAANLPREKRRREARRMKDERGMTTRQIAVILGVSQPTIVDDLRVA
jgi:hypothetical protein